MAHIFQNGWHVDGNLSAESISAGPTFDDSHVDASAAIEGKKVVTRRRITHKQDSQINVAAFDEVMDGGFVNGDNLNIIDIDVVLDNAMTGDRTVTIDVLGATGTSETFSRILAEPIVLDANTAARSAVKGKVTLADWVKDDRIKCTVTLGGSSGTIAQGLFVQVVAHEEAET